MRSLILSERTAKLNHLNTRIEKHGDEGLLRADLNFETTIRAEDIVRLAYTESTAAAINRWRDLLINTTSDLGGPLDRLAEHCISTIKFNRDFENHTLVIDSPSLIDSPRMHFSGCKICKFSIDLIYEDNSLLMRFQAQIDPCHRLDDIAESLNRVVTIHIEPPSDEDLINLANTAQVEPNPNSRGRAFAGAIDGSSTSQLN